MLSSSNAQVVLIIAGICTAVGAVAAPVLLPVHRPTQARSSTELHSVLAAAGVVAHCVQLQCCHGRWALRKQSQASKRKVQALAKSPLPLAWLCKV